DLKVARAREETIEKRLTEVFQNNSKNRQSQVKLQELETAATTYRSAYEDFLNRYNQVVEQQTFPTTHARVITSASRGIKTSPKIAFTLVLALAGGAMLGVAVALVREQMDRIIYARDHLIRELGVNCIAMLPSSVQPEEVPKWLLSRKKNKFHPIALPQRRPIEREQAGSPRLLYKKEEPFSAISEALRNIKVAVDIRSMSNEVRTLAIVSALPGEGKSSVAASLA